MELLLSCYLKQAEDSSQFFGFVPARSLEEAYCSLTVSHDVMHDEAGVYSMCTATMRCCSLQAMEFILDSVIDSITI